MYIQIYKDIFIAFIKVYNFPEWIKNKINVLLYNILFRYLAGRSMWLIEKAI